MIWTLERTNTRPEKQEEKTKAKTTNKKQVTMHRKQDLLRVPVSGGTNRKVELGQEQNKSTYGDRPTYTPP